MLFAYFRTHTPPHTLHIPLSNLPRADLALRPELDAVLHPAGLKPDDLITLTDLPRDGLDPQDTRWLLVDHNVLTGDLATRFSPLIIGCIDHHDDEGVVPHDLPPNQPRVFAKCGSCMSLVLDQCAAVWDQLSSPTNSDSTTATTATSSTTTTTPCCDDGTPLPQCDASLARVALAPILIDTTDLTSPDKTTAWDERAAALAEARLRRAEPAFDRAAFYAALSRLRERIAGLPPRDLLRKDYKRWREGALALGVSTVVQGLGCVLREIGGGDGGGGNGQQQLLLLGALRAWAREQGLDIAVVMTVSRPGGVFTRELLVWALNEEAVEAVRQFVRRFGETLGLEPWNEGELDAPDEGKGEWRACWRQRRTEHSRKQVAPMLREAMKEASKL